MPSIPSFTVHIKCKIITFYKILSEHQHSCLGRSRQTKVGAKTITVATKMTSELPLFINIMFLLIRITAAHNISSKSTCILHLKQMGRRWFQFLVTVVTYTFYNFAINTLHILEGWWCVTECTYNKNFMVFINLFYSSFKVTTVQFGIRIASNVAFMFQHEWKL